MMHSSQKVFVFTIGLTVIGASFFVAQQGFAWTNPTTNPPLSNPLITISGTNVGVGVTPSAKLHVVGSESRFGGVASGYISVYNASGRSGYIQANQGTDLRIAADSDPMTFYAGGSERARITTAGNLSVGTASPDANYKITTANGGIKADANTGQAAGYFNNIGGGPAIIAGTGGITLGGVNQTSWPSGNDNLGNHTATGGLDMAGNNINAVNFLTVNGAINSGTSGADSGMTGDRAYQFGYQEGGAWAFPYPDLILGYHTGVKLGGHYSYNGTRFYNDHPSRAGATEIFSVGNGDNHVRVLNNLYVTGNVGIGDTNPTAKLDLGTSGYVQTYSSGGSGWGGSTNTAGFRTAWDSGYGASFEAWDGGTPKWGIYKWSANTPAVVMQGQYNNTDINFTGNIAVGTTDPAGYRLNVSGDANATRLCIAGVCQSAWPTGISGSGTANYLSKWTSGSAIGNSLVYDNGSIVSVGTNLGVGTTDPLSQMAGTQGIAIFKNSYPAIGFKNDSTSWLWYGASNTFRMWNASAGDIITADTGGYVGIGKTNPGYKLDINGSVHTNQDLIADGNYGYGLVGIYSPYRYRNVYAMGADYRLSADGTSSGNFYGIANSYEPDYGGAGTNAQAKAGLGHQFLFMANGNTQTSIGTGIWTNGAITSNGSAFIAGNLGVGTTAPAYKLDVAGHIGTSGNLYFSAANPYISASSYFIAPGGAYFSSGSVYTEGTLQARGGIHDDSHANLTISGGTSGNTTFAGSITTSGTISAGAVYNPTYAP